VADPGSDGPWEWWTLGVVDPNLLLRLPNLKCMKPKWRKVPPLKTQKICYCGWNIAPMTTLTLMLTLQDPHDAKPDHTKPSQSEFDQKVTTGRTVEDRHLNFRSCMVRSCAAHDKPTQKCFYCRISRFCCIFLAENSAQKIWPSRILGDLGRSRNLKY